MKKRVPWEKFIQDFRDRTGITGNSADDWERIAQIIAYENVPELHNRRERGDRIEPKIVRNSKEIIVLGYIALQRHLHSPNLREAVESLKIISWSTFKNYRKKYPEAWKWLMDNAEQFRNCRDDPIKIGTIISEGVTIEVVRRAK